jgi:hypothetical protein
MVGCGGFGAATTGVAIIVSAAASEPATVAAVMTFLEFIGYPSTEPMFDQTGCPATTDFIATRGRPTSSFLLLAASQSCDAVCSANKNFATKIEWKCDTDNRIPII